MERKGRERHTRKKHVHKWQWDGTLKATRNLKREEPKPSGCAEKRRRKRKIRQ